MKLNPEISRKMPAILLVLTMILLLCSCKTASKKAEIAPEDICTMLEGSWVNDSNEVVIFAMEDGIPSMAFNVRSADVGRGFGAVENVDELADGTYQLTVHFPEKPATLANEAYKELIATVFVDLGKSEDQTIAIKEKNRQYEVYTYEGLGLGKDDSSVQLSEDEIWAIVEGTWTNSQGHYIKFGIQDGTPGIAFGQWDIEGGTGYGKVQSITFVSDANYKFTVLYFDESIDIDMTMADGEISYHIPQWDRGDDGFLRDP